MLLLHRLERKLVVLMLWRWRPRLRTRERYRCWCGGFRGASGARCTRRSGGRIVARSLGVRHRPRGTAPGTRDRACFRDSKPTGGERALIAVAETTHAPKARGIIASVTVEQASCSERFGCARTKP